MYFEEQTREIVVRFELPGHEREDIQLYVERRQIVVRGQRGFAGGERRVYQQVEMDYGEFERRIRLTVDVDVERPRRSTRPACSRCGCAARPRHDAAQIEITTDRGRGTSAVEETQVADAQQEFPATLPVLPLRDTVVFPDTMIPLTIGQERSIKLIDDVLASDRLLVSSPPRTPRSRRPAPSSTGRHRRPGAQDGQAARQHHAHPRAGLQRVHVERYARKSPTSRPTSAVDDVTVESKELDALRANLLAFSKIVALVPYLPEELEMAAANIEEPGALAFLIASTMRIKTEDKQALLEEGDIEQRLRKLTSILTQELEVLELGSKIQSDVQARSTRRSASTSCASR